MQTISADDFKKKYGEVALNQLAPKPVENTSVGDTAKDVAIGFGKGALQTTIGTARMTQGLGQRVVAAVDPTRNLDQVRAETGFRSLQGQDAAKIDEQLASTNNAQKAGKVVEFAAELLYPVGKTEELAGLVDKSKKVAGASFDKIGSRLSTLGDDALEDGTKVKDKVADLLVNLDQKTKSALDRTPREVFDKVVEEGKQAMTADGILTPIERVGNKIIEDLDTIRNKTMADIGERKSAFLKIPSPFKGSGIKDFKQQFNSFLNSRTMIENDKSVVKNIFQEFKKLGDTPSKGQVDKFIDYAQEALYSGEKNLVQPTSGKTTLQLRSLVSKLNNSLKAQLPKEYSELNTKYSELTRLVNEININLGKEGRSAGAFVKRLFSPSDARTKELFDQLQKETGADYLRDARLAKFVMDALGDTRAASLLEQIPTSAKSVITKGFDYATRKLADPIKGAERYINNK